MPARRSPVSAQAPPGRHCVGRRIARERRKAGRCHNHFEEESTPTGGTNAVPGVKTCGRIGVSAACGGLINHLYELRDDLFVTVIKLIEGMREIEKEPGPGAADHRKRPRNP